MRGWAFLEDKKEVPRERLRARKRVECQEKAERERGREKKHLAGMTGEGGEYKRM